MPSGRGAAQRLQQMSLPATVAARHWTPRIRSAPWQAPHWARLTRSSSRALPATRRHSIHHHSTAASKSSGSWRWAGAASGLVAVAATPCACTTAVDSAGGTEKNEQKREEKTDTDGRKEKEVKPTKKKDCKAAAGPPKPVATPRLDAEQELLHRRTVVISGSIDSKMSKTIVTQLLHLDALDETKPIRMIISSGGGVVTAGLAIYDVMQYINAPVHTMAIGHASSMAAILLAAGETGHRTSLPNARIMVHSASGSYSTHKVADVLLHAEELRQKNDILAHILANHMGEHTTKTDVLRLIERDTYMTAGQAVEAGLIDRVVVKATKPLREQTNIEATTK